MSPLPHQTHDGASNFPLRHELHVGVTNCTLADFGALWHRLEISEQQIIGDPSYLLPALRELRKGGLFIAIDDVGFGSSCLESLVMLEPEVMKIDKRCVIGIAESAEQRRQLSRYVAVANALGAEVVAEGVENPTELAVLRDLGVDYAQGFYWGMPA